MIFIIAPDASAILGVPLHHHLWNQRLGRRTVCATEHHVAQVFLGLGLQRIGQNGSSHLSIFEITQASLRGTFAIALAKRLSDSPDIWASR